MYKSLFLVAFLWLIACEKSGGDNNSTTAEQTQKPAAYDWDFYLEPSRLSVVKNERNAELKKLYYQVYGTPCGGWYDGVSPTKEKNEGWLKNFVEGAEKAQKTPIVVIYWIPNRDCGSFSKG